MATELALSRIFRIAHVIARWRVMHDGPQKKPRLGGAFYSQNCPRVKRGKILRYFFVGTALVAVDAVAM